MKLRKLNERGAHDIVAAFVVVAMALVGSGQYTLEGNVNYSVKLTT